MSGKGGTNPFGREAIGLVAGLCLFFGFLVLPTLDLFLATASRLAAQQSSVVPAAELAHAMQAVCGLALMMIVFWLTEPIPLPVTGLLPMVILPLLHLTGISHGPFPFTLANVAPNYANPVIYLFLGGFLLAGGLQKWGIDRRLTLWLLTRGKVASGAPSILLAVMSVTALISMWVSNTATAAMMLPLGLGILSTLGCPPAASRFGSALMLGIAWSASIGGIGTLIGTPPNGIAVGILKAASAEDPACRAISFVQWASIGTPFVLLFLPLAWLALLKVFPPEVSIGHDLKQKLLQEYRTLGPLEPGQRRVVYVFLLAAALWIFIPFRGLFLPPGAAKSLEWLDEYAIGILAGTLLFFIPSGKSATQPAGKGGRCCLMTWEDAHYVEWGTLLLFGGGIALSDAMFKTGLAACLSESLVAVFGSSSALVLLFGIVVVCAFLTEFASNTAVATMMAPIAISVAGASGNDPVLLVLGVAMASSLAFMLPVSTPPNALVYGSGYVRIGDMVKGGLVLDIAGAIVVVVVLALIGSWALGIVHL